MSKSTTTRTIFLLLLPSAVSVIVVVLLPLLVSFYSSFTPYRLIHPQTLWQWIGTFNYQRLVTDYDFWIAFIRTNVFLMLALNIELVLGLILALMINQITFGQRFLRTILMFPMMFSPILVGFMFNFMFNDNIGIINYLLQSYAGVERVIPWLVDGYLAFFALASAEIWNSTSVFAVILLAGLMAMPTEPIEAAKVDGCSSFQAFRHITLPYLMPFIWIAMTIRSLDVGRAYDIFRIMTNGGPAGRTEILWTMMARTGFADGRMGLANAMSYISIILSIGFTLYFFRKLNESRRYKNGD